MNNLIPGNVYGNKDIKGANKLYREMKIFPTPFKGIYYVPYESERSAWYVTDPHEVIFKAAQIYLKTNEYYFGLYTALYYQRTVWNANGIDIINKKISRKIHRKIPSQKYWRGKIIAKIMSGYPFPIQFHRIKQFTMQGITKKGLTAFSNPEKTKRDAIYLCNKGDVRACEVRDKIKGKRS